MTGTMVDTSNQSFPPGTVGERVLRSRLTWRIGWTWVGIYGAIYAGFLIALLVVLTSDSAKTSVVTRISWTVGWGVIGLLLLAVSVRFATAGVLTDESGIRIRNPLMTPRLLWQDIERFELRFVSPLFPCVCVVVLRDGSKFTAIGIRASAGRMYNDPAPAQELVDDLNAMLRATRGRA
jgi:hypothetical protein